MTLTVKRKSEMEQASQHPMLKKDLRVEIHHLHIHIQMDSGWDSGLEKFEGVFGNFLRTGFVFAIRTRSHHAGLQKNTLKQHIVLSQDVDHLLAVGGGLVEGFLKEDGAGDVLAESGNRDEEGTVHPYHHIQCKPAETKPLYAIDLSEYQHSRNRKIGMPWKKRPKQPLSLRRHRLPDSEHPRRTPSELYPYLPAFPNNYGPIWDHQPVNH
nr:hypothetical protein Iba_chr04eCG0730 [Ipomoea batatas]